MKNLVLKTALITLGSIVDALCILYGVFALFFPSNMANFLDNIGMQKASVSFYELQYEKTEDLLDLGTLCLKVDALDDNERAQKYLELLTSHEDFNDYLLAFDESNQNLITGREFFYGKLAIATQKTSGVDEFLILANSLVEDGYTEFNCFYIALSTEGLFSTEDLVKVKDALNAIKPTLSDEEKVYLDRDLQYVENI